MNVSILDIDNLHVNLRTEFSFGSNNPNWSSIKEHNEFFINRFERIFNDRLEYQGHLFLNEVLDALNIPRVQSGQIMGWVHQEDVKDIVEIKIGYDEKDEMILSMNPDRIILNFLEN